MAVDGPWNALAVRPKSVDDYLNDYAQQDRYALALKTGQIDYQNALQGQQDASAARDAAKTFGVDTDANYSSLLRTGNIRAATDYLKSTLDAQKVRADTTLATSHAANFDSEAKKREYDLAHEKLTHGIQGIATAQTPDEAKALLLSGVQKGYWSMQDAQRSLTSIPQEPNAFHQWKLEKLGSMANLKDQLEAKMPYLTTRNTGGSTQSLAVDKFTGMPTVTGSIVNTVSPDTVASNLTSRANNRDTNATHLIASGIGPDGQPIADVASTVKAIGEGRQAPPTLSALRNPRVAAMMDQVNAQYPGFDGTLFAKRQKAEKDFATGRQGDSVRSFGVALDHLDQLQQAADALHNGNAPLLNKIGNLYAQNTGGPAVNNFNTVKNAVSSEVAKVVAGTNVGQGDREHWMSIINSANSPAQLKGAIETLQHLMNAQINGLESQYKRSTGADGFGPDFLPEGAMNVRKRFRPAPANQAPAASGGAARPPLSTFGGG